MNPAPALNCTVKTFKSKRRQQGWHTAAFVSVCTAVKGKIKTEPTPWDARECHRRLHTEVEAQQDPHRGFSGYMRKAT